MRINKKYRIILLLLVLVSLPIFSMAEEKLDLPQYTEEYKRWLELSEEERKNCIEPQPYQLNVENDTQTIQPFSIDRDMNAFASYLPESYIRPYFGNVKNQRATNACWAYSATTVFETNYYVTNSRKKQFSNLHMDYITAKDYNANGFARKLDSGGNMSIALAYATNGMGIALESKMPIEDNRTPGNIQKVPADAKVNEYIQLRNKNEIKNYIYNHGVVSAYTYISGKSYFSDTSKRDLAYCCTKSDVLSKKIVYNHMVTLIGWDDSYTNESFPGKVGAYTVLNSYGTNFGENGIYHIFYEDYFVSDRLIEAPLNAVKKTVDIDYNYIYQHDTYGCTSVGGYPEGTYAANVFTRQNLTDSEKLKEISIYAPNQGNITIYINANGKDVKTSSATRKITTYISEPGYHTIKLTSPVELKNKQFAVGVKYPGRLGIEVPANNTWCATATSHLGEGYISWDGIYYTDLQTAFASEGYRYANACIKAFTDKGSPLKTNSSTATNNTTNKPNLNHTTPKQTSVTKLPIYVFDTKYYAQMNPDIVAILGNNEQVLLNHFVNSGIREGRKSSPTFCVSEYLNYNQDLIQVYGRDYEKFYQHFVNYGAAEGRRGSTEFDNRFYKYYYSELPDFNWIQLMEHYIRYGRNEGRLGGLDDYTDAIVYDPEIYLACNQDLLAVFGNSPARFKQHWIQCGINEGRISSLTYQADAYKKYNQDLYQAIGKSNKAFFEHFVRYGVNELRSASYAFQISTYLKQNSAVKGTYGNNYKLAYLHFKNFGVNENRKTCNNFYIKTYMASSRDLERLYHGNQKSYYIHYILYGRNENRKAI